MNMNHIHLYDVPPGDSDEELSLWEMLKEEEAKEDKRRFYGISEQPTPQPPPEEPSPVAKSPRKRANFFAELVALLIRIRLFLVTREDGQVFV